MNPAIMKIIASENRNWNFLYLNRNIAIRDRIGIRRINIVRGQVFSNNSGACEPDSLTVPVNVI
jgi:hypothetical protein